MKNVGVLDLLSSRATTNQERVSSLVIKKQYISITPQAISVWARQMGHQVSYATYYGIGDPIVLLPIDLDFVFVSTPTHLAPLAYALAKIFRRRKVRTVIGGPHAKSFPQDCLCYFDLVVLECDRALIRDILNDDFAPGSLLSSPTPYAEPPTVEERLPEIKTSAFTPGRPHQVSSVPMLASVGCPFSCDFCSDWNVRYRSLSYDRLATDLRYASEHLPNAILFFHDPNFGVRLDDAIDEFEQIPPNRRNRYLVESSLMLLNQERLARLHDTGCLAVAPGIESWHGYSNKAGLGKLTGREKLDRVIAQLQEVRAYIPFLQANLILGLDVDSGDEPFALTSEFLDQAPYVWPQINIPMAFCGTPLFETLLREGRMLAQLPFMFYRQPYLTIILKNYDAHDFMKKLLDLHTFSMSNRMLWRRIRMSRSPLTAFSIFIRTLTVRGELAELREIVRRLEDDAQLRAFHSGKMKDLPAIYAEIYRKRLGKYAELMPIKESAPILSSEPVVPILGRTSRAF